MMLQQSVAKSLFDSLVAANNLSAQSVTIYFEQMTGPKQTPMKLSFQYHEHQGVSVSLLNPEQVRYTGNIIELHRNQHEFAQTYGLL